jgi:hypothetical protein
MEHQEYDSEPFAQRVVGILEDGAGNHVEPRTVFASSNGLAGL